MENVIFDPKSFNKIFRELLIIGYLNEKPRTKEDLLSEILGFYPEDEDVSSRTIERALKDITEFWGIEIHKAKKEKGSQKFYIDFSSRAESYKNIVELMITYVFKDNLIKHSIDPIIQNLKNPLLFFASIYKAISRRKHITFDYFFENKGKLKTGMDLEPYDMVHRSGKWLLLGVSQKNPDNIVKQYYIHNIKNLKVNEDGEPFTVKTHLYNKDEYYKYAWDIFVGSEILEIEIWFSNEYANKIKNFPYHPTQEVTDVPDGVTVKIKTSGYIEVVNWVLGFGKNAKILKPEICKDYLVTKIQETLKIYS